MWVRNLLYGKVAIRRTSELEVVRHAALVLLASMIALSACSRSANVSITGPPELAGAEIYVDGQHAGAMKLVEADPRTTAGLQTAVRGSSSTISVGTRPHELRLEKAGFKAISRHLEYRAAGEDYIAITSEELAKTP
jgi:hypothetical protein